MTGDGVTGDGVTGDGRGRYDEEVADPERGLVLRRVVVGALDTNCWIVTATGGDALVVDPGDEPERVLGACAHLRVTAVVLTHAHWDHVLAVPGVVDALGVPVIAHPADADVWPDQLRHLRTHGYFDPGTAAVRAGLPPGRRPWDGRSRPVFDGHQLALGPIAVRLLHTPGHTPGGLTVELPGHLVTGDTLFPGGPGLTGPRWPESDHGAIQRSVLRLLSRPPGTRIHPGHGPGTTAGAEHDAAPRSAGAAGRNQVTTSRPRP